MLKSLLKLALLLIVGILVYNFFFGTPEEKEQSRMIFTEVKDLTKSAVQLIKDEKEKFDEGKYDEAVDKIGGLIDDLKGKAEQLEDNRDLIDQIAELQDKKRTLERRIEQSSTPDEYGDEGQRIADDPAEKEKIEKEWDELISETKALMEEMEQRAEK
jgi:small-conductance mechanosensitive channel